MKTRTPIKSLVVRERSYWPHIAVIGILWAGVMTWDYHDQVAQTNDMSAQMAACLRGEWRGTTADGVQLGCHEVESNEPIRREK